MSGAVRMKKLWIILCMKNAGSTNITILVATFRNSGRPMWCFLIVLHRLVGAVGRAVRLMVTFDLIVHETAPLKTSAAYKKLTQRI